MGTPLTHDQVNEAAERLTHARLAIEQIDSLGDCAPNDLASAHLIADAHAKSLGWSPIGWKVGCTSAEAMRILSCPQPFPGRVFDGTVHRSEILHHDAIHNPLLESEFGFLLGKSLPSRDSRYSIEELKDATLAVVPAFELVTSRFTDWLEVGYHSIIADSGSNGGVVFGEPVDLADCPLLADVAVALTIDGETIAEGTGADILGDPWSSLEWLANHLSARQIGLRAGEFVLSGTCTGAKPFPVGTTATATFAGLGEVTVSRTAPEPN